MIGNYKHGIMLPEKSGSFYLLEEGFTGEEKYFKTFLLFVKKILKKMLTLAI